MEVRAKRCPHFACSVTLTEAVRRADRFSLRGRGIHGNQGPMRNELAIIFLSLFCKFNDFSPTLNGTGEFSYYPAV